MRLPVILGNRSPLLLLGETMPRVLAVVAARVFGVAVLAALVAYTAAGWVGP